MNTWTVAIGAIGGLLYALMSGSKNVWPKLIDVGGRRPLPHIGLIGNVVIGIAAGELLTIIILTGNAVSLATSDLTWPQSCALFLCSFLASSTIGGYTDRRFLRLAVRNAASAPAADPATVRALEGATPIEAYVATARLAPPPLQIWRTCRARFAANTAGLRSSRLSVVDSKSRPAPRLVRVPTGVEESH